MLSVVPFLLMAVVLYGSYIRGLSKEYQDALAEAADCGQESIANARIVRSFGAEALATSRYVSAVTASYGKGALKALGYGLFLGCVSVLAGIAILVVMYYGARLVIAGEMQVGELTTFMLYAAYITLGLGSLSALYTDLMTAIGASERCVGMDD